MENLKRLYVASKARTFLGVVAALTVLGSVLAGLGTADSNITSATTQVKSYFDANLPTVITLFVGVALVIWILSLAFRSVGAKKPSKLG